MNHPSTGQVMYLCARYSCRKPSFGRILSADKSFSTAGASSRVRAALADLPPAGTDSICLLFPRWNSSFKQERRKSQAKSHPLGNAGFRWPGKLRKASPREGMASEGRQVARTRKQVARELAWGSNLCERVHETPTLTQPGDRALQAWLQQLSLADTSRTPYGHLADTLFHSPVDPSATSEHYTCCMKWVALCNDLCGVLRNGRKEGFTYQGETGVEEGCELPHATLTKHALGDTPRTKRRKNV